jgi:hypothetical protein
MTTVHIPLLDEGTDVWRTASAEHIHDDVFRIVGVAPPDERWKYTPGEVVRCRQQQLSGGSCLVAYETANI